VEVESVPDGYIVDYIDGKLREDTPEEYVRQNIEKRLVNEHGYSPDQFTIEMKIKVGNAKKRADIAIFQDDKKKEQKNIEIIVECKRESVEATDRKEGILQLQSYMAASINAKWGMWTNGKSKFVYKKIPKKDGTWDFDEPNDIPSKGRDISEIDRPTRDSLKLATEDNFLYAFRTCHNHIYLNEGKSKQQAFFELLKIIFCKILDERNITKPLEFYASSSEKLSSDGQLTVQNRVSKIYDKVKKRYPNIFKQGDEIDFSPTSIAYIVSELQKYSFLDTHIDVKGKAYEEIVGSNLRGDRGEFFTPRNVARMAIKMLDMPQDSKVLDPACGTGGFLVIGMNSVIKKLKKEMVKNTGKKESEWSDNQKQSLRDRIKELASENFFGFDIIQDLVKATKMNMVMNNDGSGNILENNSLKPPHEWKDDLKNFLCKSFNLPKNSIRRKKDLALFDIVVTNPPFGTKLPIKNTNTLEQYDLGHLWKRNEKTKVPEMTSRLAKSRPPEVLFIERCYQFLKPGGVMGIVVPDAILGAPGLDNASIREWIIQKCRILASIDLHVDTFQPGNGTQTSVLFLQKKTEKEIENEDKTGKMSNYEVFFAMADHIGHDKRGHPIYERDSDGNELFFKDKLTNIGKPKTRILKDQTNEIAELFLQWKKDQGIKW